MTGTWRLFVPGRRHLSRAGARAGGLPTPAGPCPFCPGNERLADVVVAERRGEGFAVRSLQNRYPLVTSSSRVSSAPGLRAAIGFHEVVIESEKHDVDLVDLNDDEITQVFLMYRDRAAFIEAQDGIVAANLFRNRGRRAGSSQPHPHAQVLGAVVLGREQEARMHLMRTRGRELLATEFSRVGERLIAKRDDLVALTPFAPMHNYETWVSRKTPGASLTREDDATIARFAIFARDVLRAVIQASARDYNLVFRIPTVELAQDERAFWYLEIAPRGGSGAGFEVSSGMSVVTTIPERAAEEIRGAFSRSP